MKFGSALYMSYHEKVFHSGQHSLYICSQRRGPRWKTPAWDDDPRWRAISTPWQSRDEVMIGEGDGHLLPWKSGLSSQPSTTLDLPPVPSANSKWTTAPPSLLAQNHQQSDDTGRKQTSMWLMFQSSCLMIYMELFFSIRCNKQKCGKHDSQVFWNSRMFYS